jgi:lambda repressor-like predicted transcriptional regulator
MSNTVIAKQSKEVQALCAQFTQSYNKHRKTVAEWGRILQGVRDSNLNPVNADGIPLTGEDVQVQTFSAICKELGVPRSTAYHYINTFLVTSTYPEWLQEAANVNNLNLAAQHIQDAYESMRESIPPNPDSLQVSGVVAELKKAKAPAEKTEPITVADLKKAISSLVKRAAKSGIPQNTFHNTLNSALEEAVAVAFGTPGARVTRELSPVYAAPQRESQS